MLLWKIFLPSSNAQLRITHKSAGPVLQQHSIRAVQLPSLLHMDTSCISWPICINGLSQKWDISRLAICFEMLLTRESISKVEEKSFCYYCSVGTWWMSVMASIYLLTLNKCLGWKIQNVVPAQDHKAQYYAEIVGSYPCSNVGMGHW